MMFPSAITPAQLDQARALVTVRRERQAHLSTITHAHRRALKREEQDYAYLAERLDLRRHPDRLAGLAELAQRNHPTHQARIIREYRWFLRDMVAPLKVFEGPAPKPRTVDFANLFTEARPYLIGPYLGIQQNDRWAELDLIRSEPRKKRIVMMQTGGPVDIGLWRSHMPDLNAWIAGGVTPWTWTITKHTASTVTISRQSVLPATIPYDRRYLKPGALFVGIDTTSRQPVHINFSDLTAGTYIPGASGFGKTSAMHVLLRSIFANLDLFSAVWLLDGKDGVAMSRYRNIHPKKIRVVYDDADVWQLTSDLNGLMRQRNAAQRANGSDKATRDFVAIVIDELPTFVAKPAKKDKDAHAEFLINLQNIAMRGRSAGIRLFLITQAPVTEQIPPAVRTNCATTIAFHLAEHNATQLFGELKGLPADPRKLPIGQAIVLQSDTAKANAVQFPLAELYQPPRSP